MFLPLPHIPFVPSPSLRHGQVRGRHRLHGCDAPRAGDEVRGPRGLGRYSGYLRPHYRRDHQSGITQTAAKPYYLYDGYAHLGAGLACGIGALSAGMAIGVVGDAGVRANAQQPKLFTGMLLILIFGEALALYGLIVGIILASKAGTSDKVA